MHKLIIGLVGEKGGGKETVGNLLAGILADKKVVRVRSSDILAETLTAWDLPLNRHNLQHLAIVMDGGYGKGTLSHAVKRRIETLDADVVVFDGIRWETDAELLRSFDRNFLIYVTADIKMRYERSKLRKEKVGEDMISFEKFVGEESVDTETHIGKIGHGANCTIANDGTTDDLRTKVEKCVVDMRERGVL